MPETQSEEISKLSCLRLGTQRIKNVQGHWNQNSNCTAQDSWISTSNSNVALSAFTRDILGLC